MASREPTTLTSGEVRALAERLRARATSVVLSDAPSQQSDGILAAGQWYTSWPNCKRCVVRSSAPRRAHPTWPTISANCFLIEGRIIAAPSRFGLTDECNRWARPRLATLPHQTIR